MNEQDIERQWRAASTETPVERIDAAIRAAARRDVRRRPAWSRYAPLAAAASVGVIAILLVRQSPHEDLTREAPIDAQVMTEEALTEDVAAPAAPAAPPAPSPAEAPAAAPASAGDSMESRRSASVEAPAVAAQRAAEAPAAVERKTAPPAPDTLPVPTGIPARAEAEQRGVASKARATAPAAADVDVTDRPSPGAAGVYANGEAQALPSRLLELIAADAAAVADVDPRDVEIVSSEAVTWSDGSLGCRARGEIAIQVLTPGYRVQVVAGGQPLVYHTDRRDLVRLCRTITAPEAR